MIALVIPTHGSDFEHSNIELVRLDGTWRLLREAKGGGDCTVRCITLKLQNLDCAIYDLNSRQVFDKCTFTADY